MTHLEWLVQHEAFRVELNGLYKSKAPPEAFEAFNVRNIAFGNTARWWYPAGDRGYVLTGPGQANRSSTLIVVRDESRFQETATEVTSRFAPTPAHLTSAEWARAIEVFEWTRAWIRGEAPMPAGVSREAAHAPWRRVIQPNTPTDVVAT